MTMGLMHTSYGLIPFGIAGAFFLITSAIGVGIVLDLVNRRKKTEASRWLYSTAFLTFLSTICFILLANVQNYITGYRAERIIQGLEAFKAEKGYYPPSLEALTSQNLWKVSPTAYGVLRQDFQYSGYKTGEYQIYYYSYFGVEHTYNSETKEWSVED